MHLLSLGKLHMRDKSQPHLPCKIVCLGQLVGGNGGYGRSRRGYTSYRSSLQSSL